MSQLMEGSTPGFTPRSTHTDTDAAAEFDTLRVGTPHPEHRHVVLPSAGLRDTLGTAPLTDPLAAFSQSVGQATARLVTAQMFGRFRDPVTAGLERPADVSDEAERALRERIQQRRLAQAQPQRGRQIAPTAGRGSVFQRLGGRPGFSSRRRKFPSATGDDPSQDRKREATWPWI